MAQSNKTKANDFDSSNINVASGMNNDLKSRTNRILVNVRCTFYQKAVIPMTRIFNLSVPIPPDVAEQCINAPAILLNAKESTETNDMDQSNNEKINNLDDIETLDDVPIDEDMTEINDENDTLIATVTSTTESTIFEKAEKLFN